MTTIPNPQLAPKPRRVHLFVLPLIAFLAIWPLMQQGCSCGHDFDFHLLSWMEAAAQFRHGTLFPHWAYSPAYNAGEPRFVFYPPLSWMIGAVLGLLSNWTAAPIAYTWIALTAAGLALYRFVRPFATPNAALLAAALYIVNPYMLFTAYERTAYGELLAAAWIPLLLSAILAAQATIAGLAIPIALLWLTNAPAAVIGCYTVAILSAIRLILVWKKDRRATLPIAARIIAGTLLGLCLAAFYIVPATYERRLVDIHLAIVPGMNPQSNFLFAHTADLLHDEVLHTASVVAVILLATVLTLFAVEIIAAIFFSVRRRTPSSTPIPLAIVYPLVALTLVIALLLHRISNPIWQHAPELAFLQFPWRWLVVLAAIAAFAAAVAFSRIPFRPIGTSLLAILLAAILSTASIHAFRQFCDDEDTPRGLFHIFQSHTGTDPTDEYTPITADNEVLRQNNPPYWFALSHDAQAIATTTPSVTPHHFTLNSPKSQLLILNLRDYPAWRIRINGSLIASRPRRNDGLIALPIAAGQSTIDIAWANTPDLIFGRCLTLLALLLLFFEIRRNRKQESSTPR